MRLVKQEPFRLRFVLLDHTQDADPGIIDVKEVGRGSLLDYSFVDRVHIVAQRLHPLPLGSIGPGDAPFVLKLLQTINGHDGFVLEKCKRCLGFRIIFLEIRWSGIYGAQTLVAAKALKDKSSSLQRWIARNLDTDAWLGCLAKHTFTFITATIAHFLITAGNVFQLRVDIVRSRQSTMPFFLRSRLILDLIGLGS